MIRRFVPIIFLLLLCTAIFSLTLKGIAGNPTITQIHGNLDQAGQPFELSPERGRYILLYNMVKAHTTALNTAAADAAYPDVGYFQGRFYVFFSPGVSLFAVPFFWAGWHFGYAQLAAYFSTCLFALGAVLCIYALCRTVWHLPIWASIAAASTYAFGSISLSYTGTLYEHQATAFFLLLGFLAAYFVRQGASNRLLWACLFWICVGANVLIDYPNIAFMLPIGVYIVPSIIQIVKKRKKYFLTINTAMLFTSLVLVIFAVGYGAYDMHQFGDWKKISAGLVGYQSLRQQHVSLANPSSAVITTLQNQKNPVKFFSDQNLPKGFYELLFAPDKGIVFFSPVFLLGLLAAFIQKTLRAEDTVVLATIAIIVLLYASFGDPWGGWAYGPRYLIPVMAFLSIYLGVWLTNINSWYGKLSFAALYGYSAAVAILGAVTSNAIPPKPEALALHTQYGIRRAFVFLQTNKSNTFVYNTVAHAHISLKIYAGLLYGVCMLVMLLSILLLPRFEKETL